MSEYLLKFLHFDYPQIIGGFYLFIYFNFVLWVIATFPGLFHFEGEKNFTPWDFLIQFLFHPTNKQTRNQSHNNGKCNVTLHRA